MKYDEYFYSLGVDAKDFEPNFRPGGYETFDDLLKGLKNILVKMFQRSHTPIGVNLIQHCIYMALVHLRQTV